MARNSQRGGVMSDLWSIVLAAGEGPRLAPRTQRLHVFARPEQFEASSGQRSLLQRTVERLLPIFAEERIVVVLPLPHETLGRGQLTEWPEIHVVVQPRNRGTGPRILLPLAHVLERATDASVCVLPCDRYFADDEGAQGAIRRAAAAARMFPIVVAGAPQVLRTGAPWNTFMIVACAQTLWTHAARGMPAQAAAMRSCCPVASPAVAPALSAAYERMEPCDFSRAVLRQERALGRVELNVHRPGTDLPYRRTS